MTCGELTCLIQDLQQVFALDAQAVGGQHRCLWWVASHNSMASAFRLMCVQAWTSVESHFTLRLFILAKEKGREAGTLADSSWTSSQPPGSLALTVLSRWPITKGCVRKQQFEKLQHLYTKQGYFTKQNVKAQMLLITLHAVMCPQELARPTTPICCIAYNSGLGSDSYQFCAYQYAI